MVKTTTAPRAALRSLPDRPLQRRTKTSLRGASAIVGIATVVVGLATPVTPANAATATSEETKPAPSVLIVGDSLTVGSQRQLRSRLRGHVRSLQIDARVSRNTKGGISRLRATVARRSNVWVVGLGTNDSASSTQTRKNVVEVMRLAGPRRQVVWINIVRPGPYYRVNRAFRTLDKKYENLTVVDWAGIVRNRRGLLAGDRVHLTPLGTRLRTIATCNAIAAISNPERVLPG